MTKRINNMQIKQVDYPISHKHKFYVEYNKKKYTCFLHLFGQKDFVVTGYTTHDSIGHEIINNTKIANIIIYECWRNLK